jgi:hypothetical protein
MMGTSNSRQIPDFLQEVGDLAVILKKSVFLQLSI